MIHQVYPIFPQQEDIVSRTLPQCPPIHHLVQIAKECINWRVYRLNTPDIPRDSTPNIKGYVSSVLPRNTPSVPNISLGCMKDTSSPPLQLREFSSFVTISTKAIENQSIFLCEVSMANSVFGYVIVCSCIRLIIITLQSSYMCCIKLMHHQSSTIIPKHVIAQVCHKAVVW